MDWKTETYTLAHPIKVGENMSINTVTLREPDVDALEAIEAAGIKPGEPPTVKQLRAVLEALGSLSPAEVGKLHREDFQGVCEKLVPLLDPSQTSSTPEPSKT